MNSPVCIIGGGAVGSVLAYFLYRSGFTRIPAYYGSEESVEAVSRLGGVFVTKVALAERILVPVVPRHYTNPVDECEIVFNVVKAYDVEKTVDLMHRITMPHGIIVMLQNGFGSLELVRELLGGLFRVVGGVVYFGAERKSRVEVLYHGGNTVIVGCEKGVYSELLDLSSKLRLGGLDFRVVGDVDYYRWLKLALNAVVNPITALARSRNRIVLEDEGRVLAKIILEEVSLAARKFGYSLDVEGLLRYVLRNVEQVSDNVSSMAQDIISGRKTEIDYINGFVARLLGDEGKVNAAITLLVKLLEKALKHNIVVNSKLS